MAGSHAVLELERRGWEALSSGGEAAVAFYDEVLAPEVLMLLPGGLRITDRAEALRSMGGAPWDSYALSDERVAELTGTCAVVSYRAAARRGDVDYEALVSSTYVLDGAAWRLAVHQQTPA